MNPSYGKDTRNINTLPNNEKYHKLIGSLLYLSVNTRPDITACISILSRKVAQPNEEDWNELKRVIRYLKGSSSLKLRLSNNPNKSSDLIGYADANWA